MFTTMYFGTLAGIRLYVHWTFWWLILLVVLTRIGQGVGSAISSVGFVFAIFACVFLHELGHAFSGRWFGVRTRDITLLPIGGLARMEEIPPRPWVEFVIAICGPLVNFIIAFLLFLFFPLQIPGSGEISFESLTAPTQLFLVNLGLATFNLLPVYPMDGGRILRAVLQCFVARRTAIHWTGRLGQILAILFLVYGLVTFQLSLVVIFSMMFLACTIEMFQHKMRERFENASRETLGEYGFEAWPPSQAKRRADTVDAEDVRRIF